MKKKIVFGLSIFAMMFILGGIYIVTTMETMTAELRRLVDLPHTVAFRKELLINLEKIQSGIKLKGTRYEENEDALECGGLMKAAVQRCLICHHPPLNSGVALDLKRQVEDYVASTQAILSSAPGATAPVKEAAEVLRRGTDLKNKLEDRISAATSKLALREQATLNMIERRKNLLVLIVTVGPFFAFGLAIVLISGIAKPVRSLLDATRRLKTGDLDYRIVGLQGEFGEVAASFNAMAASLKKEMLYRQRVEQLKVCGEMAAGLAHEIRNPLAGIKVSIEVLLAELQIDERDQLVLSKVIEEIRHIELLMKNFLNFARPVAAQPTNVDVNELLGKTVVFLNNHPSFLASETPRTIVQEFADRLPDIRVDPQQLKQVFLNLFLNAADAMPAGGVITARTSHDPQGQSVIIELQDTGKGIPNELIDKIFQPFFTTKVKGTGLGLAVSKRLVEDNGGIIRVANNADQGATFTIIFPVEGEEQGAGM